MNEDEIVEKLKQSLPPTYETDVSPKADPEINTGQATATLDYELDELTQYKLHDYFGEQYKPSNEESKQRIQFIYQQVANMLEDKEYGFVVAKIREIESIVGTTNSDRRIYRLYQWLKLEAVRRNIDSEMGALSNG